MSKKVKVILVILFVLIIDQWLKIYVKTNMSYGQEIPILGWNRAKLFFVENDGMAFGLELGGTYGKLALSLFRILAVMALGYYITVLLKAKVKTGLLISFALILAGALGNIIDSAFYGMIFSESHHGELATMFPPEGGYAGFLHGKVVDMFYFPLVEGYFPEWFPFWAKQKYIFFRPVFNIADVSITVGVLSILFFHRSFFSKKKEEPLDLTGENLSAASSTAPIAAEIASEGEESPNTEPSSLDTSSANPEDGNVPETPEDKV